MASVAMVYPSSGPFTVAASPRQVLLLPRTPLQAVAVPYARQTSVRCLEAQVPGAALRELSLNGLANAQNSVHQQEQKLHRWSATPLGGDGYKARTASFAPAMTARATPRTAATPRTEREQSILARPTLPPSAMPSSLEALLPTLGHMPVTFTSGSGKKFRVLCYGDSLTVGWYLQGKQYEPYGRALAESLGSVLACEVIVCGHSGHTAEQMVANADKLAVEDVGGLLAKGLRRCLNELVHRPDLVLIMAGTNDLGKYADPQRVLEDLVKLHGMCHSAGVPTIAIAPPKAPKALKGTPFEARRSSLQTMLSSWVHTSPGTAAFVDPAELVAPVKGGPCWDPDGLHLSPAGSRLLGQRLAKTIAPLLLRMGRALTAKQQVR